jgi:hypothetical protein
LAVHGQAHFCGVPVLLAIVFPPADRAQPQRAGRIQRLISTAWAAKTRRQGIPRVDGRETGLAGLREGRFSSSSHSRLISIFGGFVLPIRENTAPGRFWEGLSLKKQPSDWMRIRRI